jgi:hypothetical protein
MCFSASASFVAGGALVLLGAVTFTIARKKDKALVAIPILFGIQQVFEGIQWLYLNRGSSSALAGYGFLFFALIVWPVYVPAFVFLLDKKRRSVLRVFILAGVVIALYLAWMLATHKLYIQERESCVNYSFGLPSKWTVAPLYFLAILGALFASSRAIFRWFGVAIFLMSLVAWRLYEVNFISVWCFFAAAVSSLFFLYVQHRRSRRILAV